MGWELDFMTWGNDWWTSPFLDQVIPWLTHLGSQVAIILFILLCWVVSRRKRSFLYLVPLYAIQTAVVYGVKFLVQRPRPFLMGEVASRFLKGPGEVMDPSFPSAHTTNAFMMATLLADWFPRYRLFFYAVAGFVGWTRIYLGVHYPTDVMAGALLGYGLTTLYIDWARNLPKSA